MHLVGFSRSYYSGAFVVDRRSDVLRTWFLPLSVPMPAAKICVSCCRMDYFSVSMTLLISHFEYRSAKRNVTGGWPGFLSGLLYPDFDTGHFSIVRKKQKGRIFAILGVSDGSFTYLVLLPLFLTCPTDWSVCWGVAPILSDSTPFWLSFLIGTVIDAATQMHGEWHYLGGFYLFTVTSAVCVTGWRPLMVDYLCSMAICYHPQAIQVGGLGNDIDQFLRYVSLWEILPLSQPLWHDMVLAPLLGCPYCPSKRESI